MDSLYGGGEVGVISILTQLGSDGSSQLGLTRISALDLFSQESCGELNRSSTDRKKFIIPVNLSGSSRSSHCFHYQW